MSGGVTTPSMLTSSLAARAPHPLAPICYANGAMTRLLVLRHAESENNRSHAELLKQFVGNYDGFDEAYAKVARRDSGLSETGHLQAACVAEALAPMFVDLGKRALLVTSPMRRALDTATPLIKRARLDRKRVVCQLEMFEIGGHFLRLEKRPSELADQLEADHPLHCRGIPSDEAYAPRRAAESYDEACARIDRVIAWTEATLRNYRYDVVVMVAHGHLLTRWLRRWMRVPCGRGLAFTHANTGMTMLEWARGRGLLIKFVNDQSHLDDELSTGGARGWWGYSLPDVTVTRYEGRAPDELEAELARLRELCPLSADNAGAPSDEHDVHVIAHARGEVAGYAHYDPEHGVLRRLVVRPDHRRAGLGHQMLVEIEDNLLVKLEQDEIRVRAPSEAVAFFASQGWSRADEPNGDDGGGGQVMVKNILDLV